MAKIELIKPTLIMLYGFPGAGKTYLANHLRETIKSAHVNADKIRFQLFEQPRYDRAENEIVDQLMEYMTSEFLDAGVSVIFDTNAIKKNQRRILRDISRKKKAEHLLIWLQIDADTAFARVSQRDRRKSEDKVTQPLDKVAFNQICSKMQNPGFDEDYVVLSGKHSYEMHRTAIIKRLYDLKLLRAEGVTRNVAKPGLINLVPLSQPLDSRRNINIR